MLCRSCYVGHMSVAAHHVNVASPDTAAAPVADRTRPLHGVALTALTLGRTLALGPHRPAAAREREGPRTGWGGGLNRTAAAREGQGPRTRWWGGLDHPGTAREGGRA